MEHYIRIACPIGNTWNFICQTENFQFWVAGFQNYYQDKSDFVNRVVLKNLFKEIELREEFVEEIAPYHMNRMLSNSHCKMFFKTHLVYHEGATVISFYMKIEWKGILSSLLNFYWYRSIDKKISISMKRLKELLETDKF